MSYFKYTPFLYLILAVFFIYDAVSKWNDESASPLLSLFIAGMAVFMFFFRRRFAKKMQNRNNKS